MKKTIILIALLSSVHLSFKSVGPNDEIQPFLGQWALFVPNGAAWLDVRLVEGMLDADLLWYGGSVTPVANIFLNGEKLVVTRIGTKTRPSNAAGEKPMTVTNWIELEAFGDQLAGKYFEPSKNGLEVNITRFMASRIPALPAAPDISKIKFGKPIPLFNGTDLDGWKLVNPNASNGWKVEKGVLINNPVQIDGQPHIHYGNLRTEAEFEDFNLKIEVNVPAGSNSGIYLRGIYEVQVLDSYGKPLDSHNMGAIYSRITPTTGAEKEAGEWQNLDITLCQRHVTVKLNGTMIIDNQPLEGVTGGALTADQFKPGPIYLQGDHGSVSYRNIVLRPVIQ